MSPPLTAIFDGSPTSLYALRPWNAQLVLETGGGRPVRLRIMREGEAEQSVAVGERVTKDARGRLCRVGTEADAS